MVDKPQLDLVDRSRFGEIVETTNPVHDTFGHKIDPGIRTFEATMLCMGISYIIGHNEGHLSVTPVGFHGIIVPLRSVRIIYNGIRDWKATVTFSFGTKCPGNEISVKDIFSSIKKADSITLTFKDQEHYERSVTQLACSDSKTILTIIAGGLILISLAILSVAI